MKQYAPHKRQFLIGSRPVKMAEGWNTVPLGQNLYLSHCPTLPVATAHDANGEAWHLLGIAIQTDAEKDSPLAEIAKVPTATVTALYTSWAGRWILIGATSLHTDCGGLLGCFYTAHNIERWVSSSVAVLQEVTGLSPRPEVLKHAYGIEWYPLPTSKLEGASKLLPSQFLNLRTFRPEPRALPKPIAGLVYEEILDKITGKLKTALQNVSQSGKRIFVSLTAGHDSRLVLASAHYAGIKVDTFTRVLPHTAYADIALPKKLAKAAGYRHTYIKSAGFSQERADVFDRHNGGNTAHIVKTGFSHGQYDSFTKADLILSGGIFEVARRVYWKKMGPELSVETILKGRSLEYNPESYNASALAAWIDWVKQTPAEWDWRDRLYLEQRVAGWLSSIEQALDLMDAERLHVINCHDLISLLMSIPAEKRKSAGHHTDLISKMAPALLKYPFNPPDPAFIRLQKKVARIGKKVLKAFGK